MQRPARAQYAGVLDLAGTSSRPIHTHLTEVLLSHCALTGIVTTCFRDNLVVRLGGPLLDEDTSARDNRPIRGTASAAELWLPEWIPSFGDCNLQAFSEKLTLAVKIFEFINPKFRRKQ